MYMLSTIGAQHKGINLIETIDISAGVGIKPAPAYYIGRVKTRLASGEYSVENVSCFCGASDGIVVAHRDRYGIPHRMVLCNECSLIYATSRMTEESYRKFYNNEYRQIYDGWEFKKKIDKEEVFLSGLGRGYRFHNFITHFDITPEVVYDIGCNMGDHLIPFKEAGAEVYGCDWGIENIEFGKTKGINIISGGVDELIKLGKKADFIILNHVIEHFLNIEYELLKIRELLTPDGYLYVGVPGLYSTNLLLLFQNAHTYQFQSESLTYVMNVCGFEEYYMDEHIASIWKLREDMLPKNIKPTKKVKDIYDYFFSKNKRIPNIKTINKFSHKERKENISKLMAYGFPDISNLIKKHEGQDAIIICGGPSIDNYVNKILELQVAGAIIISIERMYYWCLSHHIIPDYIVILDASDDVNESFTELSNDTIHLISTQCRPDTAELIKDTKTYIFSTPQKGIKQYNYWGNYSRITIINGGGSVSLQSMAIALFLGSSNLHVFGFDCHITDKQYADGIMGAGIKGNSFYVNIEEKIFLTTTAYLSFAQQFFSLLDNARKSNMIDKIRIYGDSLINAMSIEDLSDGANTEIKKGKNNMQTGYIYGT